VQAFWIPSKVQEHKQQQDKPDTTTYCPASGKKLRLKDLVPVKFTRVREGESGHYMDPITHDTFTNASKLVVLVPTGDVLLEDTYTKCVKPDGVFGNPPKKIKEKDVIKMQGGGTGFAAHDKEKVEATTHHALGPGSGKADLRGQHQGPRSLGGLQFYN
jgi:nitric oxide synthase-interacting protein